jgi:hypothetical protein
MIYEQWKSSMHHFGSFNNQFYRKAIEYMQERSGSERSQQVVRGMPRSRGLLQWPLRPAHQGADRYAGSPRRTGLHQSCHAIVHVDSTMGNNGLYHRVSAAARVMTARTKSSRLRTFMTYLNPEPHRRLS